MSQINLQRKGFKTSKNVCSEKYIFLRSTEELCPLLKYLQLLQNVIIQVRLQNLTIILI